MIEYTASLQQAEYKAEIQAHLKTQVEPLLQSLSKYHKTASKIDKKTFEMLGDKLI